MILKSVLNVLKIKHTQNIGLEVEGGKVQMVCTGKVTVENVKIKDKKIKEMKIQSTDYFC